MVEVKNKNNDEAKASEMEHDMEKHLDGHDLTYSQMKGLSSLFGAPGRDMYVTNKALSETGLTDEEVKDLLNKGYLELLSSGDYLLPGDVDGNAFAYRLTEPSNLERIRQMKPSMF